MTPISQSIVSPQPAVGVRFLRFRPHIYTASKINRRLASLYLTILMEWLWIRTNNQHRTLICYRLWVTIFAIKIIKDSGSVFSNACGTAGNRVVTSWMRTSLLAQDIFPLIYPDSWREIIFGRFLWISRWELIIVRKITCCAVTIHVST